MAEVDAARAGEGRLRPLEHLFRTKDGAVRRVVIDFAILDDLMVASLTDLTDLRRSEAELRSSEKRHRLLADHAVDMIWTVNPSTGRLTYVSPSVEKLKGYTPEEYLRLDLEEIVVPEHLPEVRTSMARFLSDAAAGLPVGFETFEVREMRRDGSIMWAEKTVTGLYDEQGQLLELLGISRDITRRKKTETRLRRALEEKEKAVAELSEALDRVRTLSGLLPICSHCKKVRDDEGYWQRIERYIEQRTEATFTHGLCPTCIQGLYPGLAQEMLTEE